MFSNTIRGLLLWFIVLNWSAAVNAGDDSCRTKGSLRLRLHSSGFFPYSGRLINLHPSGDIPIAGRMQAEHRERVPVPAFQYRVDVRLRQKI